MMKTFMLICGWVAAALPAAAGAQKVPEGIHSIAPPGPVELCGIRAANLAALREAAAASARLHAMPITSDRFELFSSDDSFDQLVFTRAGEAAHPAATCRHLSFTPDGSLHQERDMRCDASREACDRLFIEFQELDRQAAETLRGGG